MADYRVQEKQKLYTSQDVIKEKLNKASNFDLNAVLRGLQLTIVGALRALQNPEIFSSEHYKQAAIAVGAGMAIQLAISLPIVAIRVVLWLLSFIFDFQQSSLDDDIIDGLDFIQKYVLQVPLFLMALMRYMTPTLDNVFMDSLKWVDKTYYQKHQGEDVSTLRKTYYENLRMYSTHDTTSKKRKSKTEAFTKFLMRFGKKTGISLGMFALSYTPLVGRFVLPAGNFHALYKVVGFEPAAVVFVTSFLAPRRNLVILLQTFFASRGLMRELLEPYFCRIRFTQSQKQRWFRDREGLLFGFGVGFYILQRIPILGVLIYGIAEASTAYLITKITDPPPPPTYSEGFAETQQEWTNKHEFLNLKLQDLDALTKNLKTGHHTEIGNDSVASTSTGAEKPPPYTDSIN